MMHHDDPLGTAARFRGERDAFGWPGIPARWTQGNKDGVGTAFSADSRVWYTVWNGCLTEIYYPTIDRPQVRDLQLLVSDGKSFLHEEKRHLQHQTLRTAPHALGYRITNTAPDKRYRIVKDVIAAPHLSCVLQRIRLEGDADLLSQLHFYVLCAPHLSGGGAGNNAFVIEVAGRKLLVAEKNNTWLALCASVPFSRLSCGFVGKSDGWTDIADNLKMDWEFDRALNGNVALTGELELGATREFTLAIALGEGLHHAVTSLFQAMGVPFAQHEKRYFEQWERASRKVLPLEKFAGDGGNLYRGSYSLLLCHEDKTFPGAFIASLSIPWGEAKGDEDLGGYHLVWTRDMVNTAMGLVAAGNLATALRALIYLAATQHEDGGFSQNFWVNGESYRSGIQLDEVSFPILLAWRLATEGGLGDFDPYPMVLKGACYLICHGPATEQERWEEAAGYSPSTLAANIAALCVAACFARQRGDAGTAVYLEDYADFLEAHVEAWTVTSEGTLLRDVKRHYIRILPVDVKDFRPVEDPNRGRLSISNAPFGTRLEFPAKEVVDAGFLELVRYGIRSAEDPLIVDSLRVVDDVLKIETAVGPCWRRYNHDGYGQREDGAPFEGAGRGQAWPLLTGERAHYEIAAGRDVTHLVRAMEGFASPTGMLPEQIWDLPDLPDAHMRFGGATGAAMPLVWAHAEYIKLLRSVRDGRVFDCIPEVASRYLSGRSRGTPVEIWKTNRQPSAVRNGATLRVQASKAFRLHSTSDGWKTKVDTASTPTALDVEFVDLEVSASQRAPIQFTFFWVHENRWEGHDYAVRVEET